MKFTVFDGGVGFMRADDHQFFQPMYIRSFGDLAASEPFDEEKTGWGWRVVAKVDTPDTILPTVCKMKRPS
jgi:branched-chain amino acid transport system substrate-binding protein